MTDAPFRYRVEHAIEQLRQAGHAASTVVPDHPGLPDALPSCDVLVLHRLEWSPRVEVIIEAARRHGVATVFDCDELVFFDGAHPHFYFLGDLSEREQQLYVEMTRNLERTARACGVVLASTPAIADKAAAMGLKTLLHRNVLSAFQERQGLWLGLARRLIPKAPLLGYFSGSHTHDRDLRSIGEPLTTVFERIPEAQLLIVGHMRCPSFAARFPGRVWVAPYLPWREVPAMMARCRALLAPLAELSPFTDAKSALKFFEPGILGVPVVASPTAEMKAAIGDGENGWLAQSPDEWVERLTVALSAHATRRTGARARDTVRAGYTTQAQRGVLAKTLAGLIAGAPARSHGAAELPGHSGKTIERP
ncbi:MAG: glycosyltransferase, partial [Planctomycetota bacterium]|nr:glycosyltransferase [Planctomycetota bacterium]